MNRMEKKKSSKLTTKVQNLRKKVRPKDSEKTMGNGPTGDSREKLR